MIFGYNVIDFMVCLLEGGSGSKSTAADVARYTSHVGTPKSVNALRELCKSAEQLADTPKSPVGDKTQRLSLPAAGNGCKLQASATT